MIIGILACVVGLIMWSSVNREQRPDPTCGGRIVAHRAAPSDAHVDPVTAWRVNFDREPPAKAVAPIDYLAAYRPKWYAASLKTDSETRH